MYSAGFACLLIRLTFFDVQFAAAALFACWAMLMIGLADLKYMIIPDQFVIMLAVTAMGFIPFHGSLWQPVLGAAIGGGVMIIAAVLGGAAFKREAMGFGDVKLFASLGLALGVKGTVIVLIGASLCSGADGCAGPCDEEIRKERCKASGPVYLRLGRILPLRDFPSLKI